MSAMTSALIVRVVGALVSATALLGPPTLPPEGSPEAQRVAPPLQPPPAGGESGSSSDAAPVPPPPPRDALPPGLQPIPFPLETQRRDNAAPNAGGEPAPSSQRRSLVDLRDPFDRPPMRPREGGQGPLRLLMPDLKDPFAPGVRRIRSKTLEQHIPNDIIDPFRAPQKRGDRALCSKTTDDGTVVQSPGKKPVVREECRPSRLDLRDPFDRDPAR